MIKTIKIEGMHCPNCVAAVKRELEAIEDIGFDVVEIK